MAAHPAELHHHTTKIMDKIALSISREASSLRNQVTNKIRDAILSGQFAPGEKLAERALCESMEISRTLLREALQHLKAEGLLDSSTHRGVHVTKITQQEARDIYQVREVLEGLAGAGFANSASAEQMQRLRHALRELEALESHATPDQILRLKNQFYAILLDGCGNITVGRILTQLNNQITLLRRISLSHQGRFTKTLGELRAILEALEARDADKARELCAAHVRKASEAAAENFQTVLGQTDD